MRLKRIYDRSYGNEIRDKRGELTGVEGSYTNQRANNNIHKEKKIRGREGES